MIQQKNFFCIRRICFQGIEELKSALMKVTLKQEYMGEKIPAAYLEMENIILKCVLILYIKCIMDNIDQARNYLVANVKENL